MDKCLCCESAHLIELVFNDQFHGTNLIQCTACKHIHIARTPDEKELHDYYINSYGHQRNKYVQKGYLKIMKNRAFAQLNYCNANHKGTIKRILDIGCGYGAILSEASRQKIQTLGLEYDTSTIAYGKKNGLPIKQISSESDITREIASFSPDLITMSHVLEHFTDPVKILNACHETRIFIEVPAYRNDLPTQFINQEGHLNFFNEDSLLALLSRSGFTVEAHGTYGPAMNFFWKNSWSIPRKILRFLSQDYFFQQYTKFRKNGIWVRALAKGPSCKF